MSVDSLCAEIDDLVTSLEQELDPDPVGFLSASSATARIRAVLSDFRTLSERYKALDDTEAKCRRCFTKFTHWSAPSPLWNLVMRGNHINNEEPYGGIICITCFIDIAGDLASGWRVHAEKVNGELKLVTPSGRVWNGETWLWEERVLNSSVNRNY